MPSVLALRALLGASLGLGALDLVWLNAALAPRLDATPTTAPTTEVEPARAQLAAVEPAPALEPERAAEPAVVAEAAVEPEPAPVVEDTPAAPRPGRIYFATGSAGIDRAGCERLRPLVTAAAGRAITVEGHADYRGVEATNEQLSRDRAQAVAACLVRLGASEANVHITYRGETDAATTGALWRDRRVDVVVAQTNGAP